MQKRALRSSKNDAEILTASLPRLSKGWLLDCEIGQHSHKTIEARKNLTDKLLWFLTREKLATLGPNEVRAFLAYLTNGHCEQGGRWGNKYLTEKVGTRTVKDYYGNLRTFFNWLILQDEIEVSPLARIAPPVHRPDQVQPFSAEQVNALLEATRDTPNPRRNLAIVLLMLDTGMRVSELCGLNYEDVNLQERRCIVLGKGNKKRTIPFGRRASQSLNNYISHEDDRDNSGPFFQSYRGMTAGEALTNSGVLIMIKKLGTAAGIEGIRCSPHTFRHTFAVMFLRNGGNVFTLQHLLGHEKLDMTNRYVTLAQADIENQHRQFSPADRIKKKR